MGEIRKVNWDTIRIENGLPLEVHYDDEWGTYPEVILAINPTQDEYKLTVDSDNVFHIKRVSGGTEEDIMKYDPSIDRIFLYKRFNGIEFYMATAYGPLFMNSYRLYGLPDPVSDSDAATKKYVDDKVTSISSDAFKDRGFFIVPEDGTLQDAIDWANTNGGGIIYVKAGTYEIDPYNPLTIPSNTWLIGINNPVFTFLNDVSGKIIDISNQSNIVIKNITVDVSSSTAGILSLTGSGISNVVLDRVSFKTNYKNVDISGNNIFVINSEFRSHYNQINFDVTGSKIYFIGNRVINGYFGIGNTSYGADHSVFAYNYIYCEDPSSGLVVQDGIFFGGTTTSSKTVIHGNIFETRDIGIRISGDYIRITDNAFDRQTASGQLGLNGILLVDTTNSIVSGNIIKGYTNNAIMEVNSSATSDYNMIINNRILNGALTIVGANTLVANNLVG